MEMVMYNQSNVVFQTRLKPNESSKSTRGKWRGSIEFLKYHVSEFRNSGNLRPTECGRPVNAGVERKR